MYRFKIFVFSVCTAIVASFAMTAWAENMVKFEPAESTLQGKLLGSFTMKGSEFLKGNILYLDEPITIAGNEESTSRKNRRREKSVETLLLEFPDGDPADDVYGARVEVTGQIDKKYTAAFRTNVTMTVTSMTIIEPHQGDGPVATFSTGGN